MKSNESTRWMRVILLATLTVFSLAACHTTKGGIDTDVQALHPALPAPADIRPVQFDDAPELGGLLLSYEDYRALRHNIIEYRREIEDLRDTIAFYRGEESAE